MHEPASHDGRWDETRQQVNKGDRNQKKKAKKETCHMPQAGSGSSRADVIVSGGDVRCWQ